MRVIVDEKYKDVCFYNGNDFANFLKEIKIFDKELFCDDYEQYDEFYPMWYHAKIDKDNMWIVKAFGKSHTDGMFVYGNYVKIAFVNPLTIEVYNMGRFVIYTKE